MFHYFICIFEFIDVDSDGALSLEELVLTYDDIFGDTALVLGRSLGELPRLTVLDLTRNRISKRAMDGMRAAVGPRVAIRGAQLQTFAPC